MNQTYMPVLDDLRSSFAKIQLALLSIKITSASIKTNFQSLTGFARTATNLYLNSTASLMITRAEYLNVWKYAMKIIFSKIFFMHRSTYKALKINFQLLNKLRETSFSINFWRNKEFQMLFINNTNLQTLKNWENTCSIAFLKTNKHKLLKHKSIASLRSPAKFRSKTTQIDRLLQQQTCLISTRICLGQAESRIFRRNCKNT